MEKLLNLNLLFPNDKYVKYMSEVKSSKLFNGNEIHKEGLYSEEVFGPVGSEMRMSKFGYINLYSPIIHPLIYSTIISLSNVYKKVAEGKKYVILKNGEYIDSDEDNGSTGYTFFLSTFKQLKFEKGDSSERNEKITFLDMHPITNYDKLLVYPCGLRDFSLDRHGNIKEHEMVEYYTKILSVSNMVKEYKSLGSDVDDIFVKMQNLACELYDYLFSLIDGKNKVIGKNFVSRYVDHGTFNVYTSTPVVIENMDDDINVGDTQLGILQYIKGIDPIAKYCLDKFVGERCFSIDSNKARLFTKDFKTEYIDVDNKARELWTTQRGMDTIFNMAYKDEFLNSTVIINDHYPLVIESNDKEVIIHTDSESIPEGVEVRGITYGEILFYMLIIDDDHKKYPAAMTRHPVAGPNSIFITGVKLNTTTKSKNRLVYIKDETEFVKRIINTPIPGYNYMMGFTPPLGRLSGAGADFDGDKGLTRILFTEESMNELNVFMNSVPYYVNNDQTPTHDLEDGISKFTMLTLTQK